MSKNFLVTGAARGIGRGLSRLLLQKGHRVFLLDNNVTEVDHMNKQLPIWFPADQTSPSKYQLFQGDMSKKEDIERAASSASEFFDGKLDVLVNNAAATRGVIHETKFDQEAFLDIWTKSLQVNLTGSMLMSRACLPLLKKTESRTHGGSIIFISSTRAYQSEPNSESYATTKAGLLGLSQALSCSLAEDNIAVNAILPGWINVVQESKEGDEKGMGPEDGLSKEDREWHFSGRVGRVEDILRAVEYLSEGDSFVTGQEITVDGGVGRRMVYPE